jgi:hypothetical protein
MRAIVIVFSFIVAAGLESSGQIRKRLGLNFGDASAVEDVRTDALPPHYPPPGFFSISLTI